jgi:enterochelin esterase-like enzyme
LSVVVSILAGCSAPEPGAMQQQAGGGAGGGATVGAPVAPTSGSGGALPGSGGAFVGGSGGSVATAGTAGSGGGGAGEGAGVGGGGVEPKPANVELASAIPPSYKQPVASAGTMSRRSYPCHYYTDEKAGIRADPRELVLERRAEPITKQLNVYVPPGYDAAKKYPVVYVLHGITDNENTWLERGDPQPSVLLDNLIAKGDIRPLLAVFPNGNSSSDFLDRAMSNQAGYYYFSNELVGDIIPFIEQEYSAATDRDSRGLCGFSMGGMQTINAGMCQSLEHFSWFGAFAAAPTTYSSDDIAEYLGWENETASFPIRYFYNVVGEDDPVARSSHAAATNGLIDKADYLSDASFVVHTVPGAHNYSVSSIGLYNFLRISFPN